MSINKKESTDLNFLNGLNVCIKYSNDMDDKYNNIEDQNPNKKRKMMIVFGDMTAYILSNKKRNPIVTELFSCFDHTVLFCCSQKYYTKFNTLFCYKNSKQKRISTNCI